MLDLENEYLKYLNTLDQSLLELTFSQNDYDKKHLFFECLEDESSIKLISELFKGGKIYKNSSKS